MTSRRTLLPAAAGLAIATLGTALPASATQWVAWENQDAHAPQIIYTDSADQPGALLVCDAEGQLSAMIPLEPASLPRLLSLNAVYARSTDGSVRIGEGEPASARFRYVPALKSVELRSHSLAAKVFNAAILGEPLKVETRREGSVEAELPSPNETFKAFAKTCGALRDAAATD